MPTARRRQAEQGERLLLGALDAGVRLVRHRHAVRRRPTKSCVGRVCSPRHRSRITLASKCGMAGIPVDGKMQRVIDGRPTRCARNCENSLRRLQTDVIDLYYLHRWDKPRCPSKTAWAPGDLVRKGKIRSGWA
jgi:aryl-alcohol dehydrogenase-like predicted oxidoreductase